MADKEVDLEGRRGVMELEGVEVEETKTKICYMKRESILNKRKIGNNIYFF